MKLPQEFKEKMEVLLGADYEAFLASYGQPRHYGLRVNTQKITPKEFERIAPFHLTKISWIENGYYYQEDDAPGRHPFYHAGLYYLQEPSAMTPAAVLPVTPGDRVLDLCAAPGGKATELGAKLMGKGLLVANDLSASRARALLKNIEVFGIRNAFVTNASPARLSNVFPGFFDKILVDAPCSGEGMFRKDPAAVRAWTVQKPQLCAARQREIISRAAQMLAPGGLLLYSTCTFSPEENEETVAFLLKTRGDMELLPIPLQEGFSPGFSGETLRRLAAKEDSGLCRIGDLAVDGKMDLTRCARIFPHKMGGEGHFLALLRKKGEATGKAARKDAADREKGFWKSKSASAVKMQNGVKYAGRRGIYTEQRISKEERAALIAFFAGMDIPWDWDRVEVRGEQVYLTPVETVGLKGIPFLRNGLFLGEVKKGRFEPSQSLAMALTKESFPRTIDLDWRDERVLRYLKGETIGLQEKIPAKKNGGAVKRTAEQAAGWELVCVNGFPLGWGKAGNGILKNKYHAGWRLL